MWKTQLHWQGRSPTFLSISSSLLQKLLRTFTPTLSIILLSLHLILFANAADVIEFTIPSTILPNVSAVIDPRFAGFGIEFSNIFSFTGQASSPNSFSYNLLNNLKSLTGVGPTIRVGGNTQDTAEYQSNYTASNMGYNPYPTLQNVNGYIPFDQLIYGDELFDALNTFPTTTQYIFGLNMAYDNPDYLTRIVDTASAAVTELGDRLYSFEIGNEPDLYDSTSPYRSGMTWDGAVYTQQWLQRAEAIQQQVLGPAGRPNNTFEAGCTASTIGTTFEIEDLAGDGIDITDAVFHYNQHDYFYYIQVSTFMLTRSYMMNHNNIVGQFIAWADQVQEATAAGKPYLLGEMASIGPQGLAGVSDVFGCALWSLDFFLYAATINITHVLMHMTDVGNQSMWQPIEVGGIDPWVRPVYYGHVVVDTLIGSANDTSIAEIDVTTQELQDYAGEASAYVIYRSNTIYATVLINMKEFNSTDTETSDTQLNFTVNIPPAYAGNNLTVLKLSAPGADSFKQVTWAGLDYQTDSGLPSVAATNDTTFVTVSAGGQFSVLVRDTQAVVVLFNSSAGVTLNTASAASSQGTSSSSENGNTTLLGPTNSTSGNSTDGSGGEGGSDSTKSAAFGRIMCNLPLMSVLCICTAMVLGANSFMFG